MKYSFTIAFILITSLISMAQKYILIVLFGFLCFSITACNKDEETKDPEIQEKTDATLEIYLLIGQSNMAGRAEIEIPSC